jgi:hypothetical protein
MFDFGGRRVERSRKVKKAKSRTKRITVRHVQPSLSPVTLV